MVDTNEREIYWLIWFEDCDRQSEFFTDEQAARLALEKYRLNWAAHLFKQVD